MAEWTNEDDAYMRELTQLPHYPTLKKLLERRIVGHIQEATNSKISKSHLADEVRDIILQLDNFHPNRGEAA